MNRDEVIKVISRVKGILPGDHGHRLVDAVKISTGPYIEIGALCGASTVAIALAKNDDEIVISIDPFRIEYLSDMAKGIVAEVLGHEALNQDSFYAGWVKQVNKFAKNEKIIPVIGDRLEKLGRVKTLLAGRGAGFLFIDGLHMYEAVRDELLAYLPLMRHGAIVAFHDYAPKWGVYEAVQEAIKDGRLEIVTDNYLLVTRTR